jgi:hypothetical protein
VNRETKEREDRTALVEANQDGLANTRITRFLTTAYSAIVLTKFEARWRATPARVAPENSSVAKLAGFAVNTQPEEIDI